MPTPPKSLPNMRKHLTNSERESRQAAESRMKRPKRIYLRAPGWLSEDGRRIFQRTKELMRGLELLDTLDTETLALYADTVAKYQAVAGKSMEFDPELTRAAQAWSRVALQYAEKLGITPTARARLAKKQAERKEQDEFEQLLDDVTDYMNEDHV